MAIFCCCSYLRSQKKTPQPTLQDDNQRGLPVRPPPARLPPPEPLSAPTSPQSTVDRSSLTNPLPGAAADSSVQLGELVVEDSDDGHGEDGLANDSKNRSTSTLQAVKAAIRRHLSQDSLTRRSETEEQIARRAEVKRLMRQRIQEELRSETNEVRSESSTPHRHGNGSIHFPGNGPRDTIEFTVDDAKRENDAAEMESLRLTDSTQNDQCRRLSRLSKKSSTQSPNAPRSDRLNHLRRHSSVPDIPSSPVLEPLRVPSFYDASSLASWRLSLSADKLVELFDPDRAVSPFRPVASSSDICSPPDIKDWEPVKHMRSRSSPLVVRDLEPASRAHSRQASICSDQYPQIPTSHSLIRGESPVGLWLRTQSQNFRLSSASQSAHESEDESFERSSSGLTVIPCLDDVATENPCAESIQNQNIEDGTFSQDTPGRSITMIKRKRVPSGPYSCSHSAQSTTTDNPTNSVDASLHKTQVSEPISPSSRDMSSSSAVSDSAVPFPSPPAEVAFPSVKDKRWIGFDVLRLSYFQRESCVVLMLEALSC